MVATIVVSLLLIVLCVVCHMALFRWMADALPRLKSLRRWRITTLVVGALVVHLFEIVLFTVGFWILAPLEDTGALQGSMALDFDEFFYYSAVTYTTLGFGDITPIGPLRILTAVESLTGLILIAWTASIILLAMQHLGRELKESYEAGD
jgi:hypothetical protein